MTLRKYLAYVCLWTCLYQVLASETRQEEADENEIIANVNGDYILELGNQYNDSTLRLIGKIYKNYERNMSIVKQEARVEYFLAKLCQRSECDEWSAWPECPAVKGHFAVVTRYRDCGRNTSKCTYPAHYERTETESAVCVGRHEEMADKGSIDGTRETERTGGHPNDQVLDNWNTVDQTTERQYCAAGYQYVDGYCFRPELDLFFSHSMAKRVCEEVNRGLLVHMDTVKKMEAVYFLLESNRANNVSIWIDGSLSASSQLFRYRNGLDPVFNNWAPGHPTPYDDQGLYIVDDLCKADVGPDPRSWILESCKNQYNFVCEDVPL